MAIIGRPNVGKSTLLNTLTGRGSRHRFSYRFGTTRDAVDEKVSREGADYVFVDTAGIRRKGKTRDMAEKLSVVMARRHIRMAHVVLLMLDATEGVVGLDATIAGYAHEGGRAVIICVNKWDEVKGQTAQKKNEFEENIRDEFKFLDYAPIVFLFCEERRRSTAAFQADPRMLRIGLAARDHRRIEPLCRPPKI